MAPEPNSSPEPKRQQVFVPREGVARAIELGAAAEGRRITVHSIEACVHRNDFELCMTDHGPIEPEPQVGEANAQGH